MPALDSTLEATATSKVADAIRARIRDGHLGPRMRVPTEVALCRQMGVSRTTVRAALRTLHATGDIQPVTEGRGWEVAGDASPGTMAGGDPERERVVGVVSELATFESVQGHDHHSAGWSFLVLAGMLQALAERGLTAAVRPVDGPSAAANPADAPDAADGADRLADVLGAPGPRPAYPAYLVTHDAAVKPALRERLATLRAAGVPVAVQMDTESPLPFDQVMSDHAAGAEMLTEWLFSRGCRNVLVALPWSGTPRATEPWVPLRLQGVERAHRKAGIAMRPLTPLYPLPAGYATKERFQMQIDNAYGFLGRAFAETPDWDAVMCSSDGETFAMIEALRRMGGRAADIPVVGYDGYWSDCPEFLWCGRKPVATVDKRNRLLGRTTVEVLEERRADESRPDPIIRRVQPELRPLV